MSTSRPLSDQAKEALKAVRDGHYTKAAELFDKLGQAAVDDFELARAAGFTHLQLGNPQGAVTFLKASLDAKDDQPDVHAAIGDTLLQYGDPNTALKHLRRATELRPAVAELHHKLGLALIDQEIFDEAVAEMQRAVELSSRFLAARLGLARALTELKRFPEAETVLDSLSADEPDNFAVDFRRGKLREKQSRFDDAVSCFETAAAKSQDSPDVCEALGLVQLSRGRPDEALAAFRRGLDADPGNVTILAHDSSLRYEMADADAFAHYRSVVGDKGEPVAHGDYIQRLIYASDFDQASEQLAAYRRLFGETPAWAGLVAELHLEQHNFDEALKVLSKATMDDRDLMVQTARALMGRGDIYIAMQLLHELLYRDRTDQYLLAMLSTCYRLNDPEAYAALVDYDKLVSRSELAVPKGYSSIAEFNAVLLETLRELHVTKVNPLTQSVVGGTQTPGNLLLQPHPVIQSLRAAIHATLKRELGEAFFASLNDSSPVNVARGCDFDLQAAWSIWVTEGGYHRTHVHSRGWYSSAYYVHLPTEVRNAGPADSAGALAFGKPGVVTPRELGPDRIVPPEEGILTLFPSYVWHETLPFKSDEPRVVVAFDAVPIKRRS